MCLFGDMRGMVCLEWYISNNRLELTCSEWHEYRK